MCEPRSLFADFGFTHRTWRLDSSSGYMCVCVYVCVYGWYVLVVTRRDS